MGHFRGRYESPAATPSQVVGKPTVIWYQSGQEPGPVQLAGQLGWLEQEFSQDAISCCAVATAEPIVGFATFGQGDLTSAIQQQANDLYQGLPGRLLLGFIPVVRRWHLVHLAHQGSFVQKQRSQLRFAVLTESQQHPATDLQIQGWATEQLIATLGGNPALQTVRIPASGLTDGQLYQGFLEQQFDVVLLLKSQQQLFELSVPEPVKQLAESDISDYQPALQLSRPLTVDSLFWRHYPQLVLRFVSRVLDTEDWALRNIEASADYLALKSAASAEFSLRRSLDFTLYQLTAHDSYKNYLFRQAQLAVNFAISDWIEAIPLQILRAEGGRQSIKAVRSLSSPQVQVVASLW